MTPIFARSTACALAAALLFASPAVWAEKRTNPAPRDKNPQENVLQKSEPRGEPEKGDLSAAPAATPEALIAALAQDYEPNPAIWRLADEDTTIYMLGTIHILPEGFQWRSPALEQVIAEADELILESDDEDEDPTGLLWTAEMVRASQDRPVLSERVSPGNKPKLETLARAMDMPLPVLDRMPLWMMSFMVHYEQAEIIGSTGDYGVETVLTQVFKDAGKPIGGIEDALGVLRAMSAVDDPQMLADFDEALSAWDGESDFFAVGGDPTLDAAAGDNPYAMFFADDHAWARGQPETLADDLSPEFLGEGFYKVLIVDRNRAWTGWLEDRLQQPGTILLAVGAGHLAGPDSVQNMLAERGLTAERVH